MLEWVWIGLCLLLLGMSKGGFPIGSVAVPVLILVWPDQATAARSAVAFLLPVLCAMDIVAIAFYRRHIHWRLLLPLFPGMLLGVVLASLLFVSANGARIAVSDAVVKLCVGVIGLTFCLYQLVRRAILRHLDDRMPGPVLNAVFGLAAGITSTIAHAAGPVMHMYLLPRKLPKLAFAGTNAAFFLVLNAVKLLPFALLGRIESGNLVLAGALLPVVPVGVGLGYLIVHRMHAKHYVAFIYTILFVTSCVLIAKAIGGA